jgi:hypothetical protein
MGDWLKAFMRALRTGALWLGAATLAVGVFMLSYVVHFLLAYAALLLAALTLAEYLEMHPVEHDDLNPLGWH